MNHPPLPPDELLLPSERRKPQKSAEESESWIPPEDQALEQVERFITRLYKKHFKKSIGVSVVLVLGLGLMKSCTMSKGPTGSTGTMTTPAAVSQQPTSPATVTQDLVSTQELILQLRMLKRDMDQLALEMDDLSSELKTTRSIIKKDDSPESAVDHKGRKDRKGEK